MVVEIHKAWKKWQDVARGLEQAYDDGLHDYSDRHEIGLLENATAVATITPPVVNRSSAPTVPAPQPLPQSGPPPPPPMPQGGLNVPPPAAVPAVNLSAIQQAQQQQEERARKINKMHQVLWTS